MHIMEMVTVSKENEYQSAILTKDAAVPVPAGVSSISLDGSTRLYFWQAQDTQGPLTIIREQVQSDNTRIFTPRIVDEIPEGSSINQKTFLPRKDGEAAVPVADVAFTQRADGSFTVTNRMEIPISMK